MMIKKKGYVGIMVTKSGERKSVLLLHLRSKTSNVSLFCFTQSSIDWKSKTILGLHRVNHTWKQSRFPFPKVVYNSCYALDHNMIKSLEKKFGRNKCFNHITQFNKREIHEILSKTELQDYLPQTVSYDKETSSDLLEVYSVLYFKPCYGCNGKGVYRVEKLESGEIHLGHNHSLPTMILQDASRFKEVIHEHIRSTHYIIQRGIEVQQFNGQNFDIRVLVQKNKKGLWSVTNIISRIAYNQYYNTSICEKVCMTEEVLNLLYPADQVNALIHSLSDISLRAAELIENGTKCHLGELSVDFVLDKDRCIWMIETNGKPQKNLYKEFHNYYNVYKRPLQYARYLLTHGGTDSLETESIISTHASIWE